jgi:hypothetical protein
MAVLPSQGGSEGTWGTELNTWLLVEHSATGTHTGTTFYASMASNMVINEDQIITNKNELIYV